MPRTPSPAAATSNPSADDNTPDPVMDEHTMPAAPAGLLAKASWGVVVVDRRYDVQSSNPAARRLLGIYQDAVGEDIVHLARGVPSAPLRAAIDAAFRDALPARVEKVVPVILPRGRAALSTSPASRARRAPRAARWRR